jgi:hypothetical protein
LRGEEEGFDRPSEQGPGDQEGRNFAVSNHILAHEFQRQQHRGPEGWTDDHMIDHVIDHVIFVADDCQKISQVFYPAIARPSGETSNLFRRSSLTKPKVREQRTVNAKRKTCHYKLKHFSPTGYDSLASKIS